MSIALQQIKCGHKQDLQDAEARLQMRECTQTYMTDFAAEADKVSKNPNQSFHSLGFLLLRVLSAFRSIKTFNCNKPCIMIDL